MRNLFYLTFLLIVWTETVHAVKVGFPAPPFTLPNTTGELISLSDFKGKHVVLEWFNPDCVRVQGHYQQKTMRHLALDYMSQEVIWLAINSAHYMKQEDNIRWKEIYLLHYRLLSDFSGEVGELYQAETTPQMYVINPSGILIYKGAIDDNYQEDNPRPSNHVQVALEESLAGLPVTQSETEPYGCLVKYAYDD